MEGRKLEEKATPKRKSSHVQSVERALLLVDLLAKEQREMSLTEISKSMGWPKSTVHGLLSTLRDFQYIDQSPASGHYQLGIRFFELGNIVARGWDVRLVARPIMRRLNDELGETVQLATEDNGEVLYLEKMDSTHLLRIVSDVGVRLPMHCSGLGKVLLAHKTSSEVKWIVSQKGLKAMTSRTITTLPELEKELEKVRQNGYGTDNGEIMDSLRCVAAPVWDGNKKVRYALSVSGIGSNMRAERYQQVIERVKQAAEEISYEMGYRDGEMRPR
ncbi:IclR family transcriptional regulator [Ruminococcaceae bacterium OttesenSCG-928-A16]|nr:IclR family transcriptional regulator [Ruminococcaceae bacterium OttesenSCG-928-A16]